MNSSKLPAYFLSHGGGPWPWMDEMRDAYKITVEELRKIGSQHRPKAILMVTAHWETDVFTVSTGLKPEMIYDYGGFPAHTYQIKYPAPGSPEVSSRVLELLQAGGVNVKADPGRGYDHGTFVPLYCLYPEADVPVVQLSIKSSYDPAEHFKVGEFLRPLREEGVLIVGSGLTYHNLRNFFNGRGTEDSRLFEEWLERSLKSSYNLRKDELLHWEKAPRSRESHPREDHLVPLFVIAGVGGEIPGIRIFKDTVYGIEMGSYKFD
jgi:aromatic ring-opening dioxygenase catalytic subunit (LigB family)